MPSSIFRLIHVESLLQLPQQDSPRLHQLFIDACASRPESLIISMER